MSIDDITGTAVKVCGMDGTLHVMAYANGRLAIEAFTEQREPLARLTVNLPDAPLEHDEIIVKTWSENEEIAKVAMETGLFEDTGIRIPTGYVEAQVWRIK